MSGGVSCNSYGLLVKLTMSISEIMEVKKNNNKNNNNNSTKLLRVGGFFRLSCPQLKV